MKTSSGAPGTPPRGGKIARSWLCAEVLLKPPAGEELDIKSQVSGAVVHDFLVPCEQIQRQRATPRRAQCAGDGLVVRTVRAVMLARSPAQPGAKGVGSCAISGQQWG